MSMPSVTHSANGYSHRSHQSRSHSNRHEMSSFQQPHQTGLQVAGSCVILSIIDGITLIITASPLLPSSVRRSIRRSWSRLPILLITCSQWAHEGHMHMHASHVAIAFHRRSAIFAPSASLSQPAAEGSAAKKNDAVRAQANRTLQQPSPALATRFGNSNSNGNGNGNSSDDSKMSMAYAKALEMGAQEMRRIVLRLLQPHGPIASSPPAPPHSFFGVIIQFLLHCIINATFAMMMQVVVRSDNLRGLGLL